MSIFSDDYILGIIENINNPPASISSIGSECVNDKSYYFDNSKRPLKYLFQYTISGYGTVEYNGNIYRVGPGQGFFLKWPTESKYYYDEGNGTEPWQFLYIIIDYFFVCYVFFGYFNIVIYIIIVNFIYY